MTVTTGINRVVVTDSISTVAAGTGHRFQGKFNASVQGTFEGTVKLQRSYDGVTYETLSRDSSGTETAFTAPCSLVVEELESGVYYRWNVTARASGTFECRLSQ